MKKKVSLLMFLLSMACMLNAQDVILKTNGEEVQAKVQEVGANEVKYKKFGNEFRFSTKKANQWIQEPLSGVYRNIWKLHLTI